MKVHFSTCTLIGIIGIFLMSSYSLNSQQNIHTTKPSTTETLKGDYTVVATYNSATREELAMHISEGVNPDSLKSYLEKLVSFETRNTGSDTLSENRGIGAARTWVYNKFEQFNKDNGTFSLVDYLEFDQGICGMSHHKNVLMVHPGMNPDAGVIFIEGHMDSRCETSCDRDCIAQGAEDNGSGTALVMELARVMTKKFYERTLVFMATTGEEQGLHGASAMAQFCLEEGVNVKAVLNNDIVGGIICGETSSPPSCEGPGSIDSTQVRIFSAGSGGSPHKSLARYIKLEYTEELLPLSAVPMQITIMSQEDRGGRGGDHIPFRELGFHAVRFTAANEHGDAGIHEGYHDHQHTSEDILGIDTDGDGELDSFYLDFNYLARNTQINGLAAAMIGINPETPEINVEQINDKVRVTIFSDEIYDTYRIGVRTNKNDFDTLYTFTGSNEVFIDAPDPNTFFFISASVVDNDGVESCFSEESNLLISSTEDVKVEKRKVTLYQNWPNPFDYATNITWYIHDLQNAKKASIQITDISGKVIATHETHAIEGFNEWLFIKPAIISGQYFYSLFIDQELVETKNMILAF